MLKRPNLSIRHALLSGAAALASLFAVAQAEAADPIKIAVIAEAQAIAGASIPRAAQLAADEINAKGGVDGRQDPDHQLRQSIVPPPIPCVRSSAPSTTTR